MAGGAGDRLRKSGVDQPKPLVQVRGATLVERSLYSLLRADVKQIVVSVSSEAVAVREFVSSRCSDLARAAGASVSLLEEEFPLGNIGCAAALAGMADIVPVIYADNLTTLDVRALVAHHASSGVQMTLATHVEAMPSPFGELALTDGLVERYHEKPVREAVVCSGVAVLGERALLSIPRNRAFGLVDLFATLRQAGEPVAAFQHESEWVDVNDREALERARELAARRVADLDLWMWPPRANVVRILVVGGGGVLLERVAGPTGQWWTTPSVQLGDCEQPDVGLARLVSSESSLPLLASFVFDDIELASGAIGRQHVFVVGEHEVASMATSNPVSWISVDRARAGRDVDPVAARALSLYVEGLLSDQRRRPS